jgi:hypothetical protein
LLVLLEEPAHHHLIADFIHQPAEGKASLISASEFLEKLRLLVFGFHIFAPFICAVLWA